MNRDQRFSFEFFPPKTDAGKEKLKLVSAELNALGPDFFSVTYGAGGSTRANTKDTVISMNAAGISTVPHLSFGNDDEQVILDLLRDYKAAGISRIVALRGDIPSGMGAQKLIYAEELVHFIRDHTGDHFQLEVAITQYFYNVEAYFYFVEQCQKNGIDRPIYPGIMPITNYHNLARFSKNCGAEIPRWICQRLESFGNDSESVQAFGIEVVTQLCQRPG